MHYVSIVARDQNKKQRFIVQSYGERVGIILGLNVGLSDGESVGSRTMFGEKVGSSTM